MYRNKICGFLTVANAGFNVWEGVASGIRSEKTVAHPGCWALGVGTPLLFWRSTLLNGDIWYGWNSPFNKWLDPSLEDHLVTKKILLTMLVFFSLLFMRRAYAKCLPVWNCFYLNTYFIIPIMYLKRLKNKMYILLQYNFRWDQN